MNLEKLVILLIIGAFIVTSVNSLNALGPTTREEAIEISKNSGLVKEGLAIAATFAPETNYFDFAGIEQMMKLHSEQLMKLDSDYAWLKMVPEGHGIWEVFWYFSHELAGGYIVIVIVDAETRTMIFETKGIQWF